jgi:hypothetical protein
MNLPFSPTFFRKIDLFQQLMEFENQKDKKHLWDGEKAVLIWASSEHHQHLGSTIDDHHVKDALNYCVVEKYLTEANKERMKGSLKHILESLPVYGFGDLVSTADPKTSSVRINRNGILAGRILAETNSLTNTWKYRIWIFIWWLILITAGVLLLTQTIIAVKSLFQANKLSDRNVNYIRNFNHNQRFNYPRINK